MDASYLISLGNLRLTVALAGAVAAWLVAADCYRVAVCWCLAFSGALGMVAISKILYLGWGIHAGILDFKAVSGHAAGATAVLPVVLYLATASCGRRVQPGAMFAGWAVGLMVAWALVLHGEHTVTEALAGWILGVLASSATWRAAQSTTIRASLRGAIAAGALMVVLTACMQVVPAGWWMVKTALVLSGAQRAHPWNDC